MYLAFLDLGRVGLFMQKNRKMQAINHNSHFMVTFLTIYFYTSTLLIKYRLVFYSEVS